MSALQNLLTKTTTTVDFGNHLKVGRSKLAKTPLDRPLSAEMGLGSALAERIQTYSFGAAPGLPGREVDHGSKCSKLSQKCFRKHGRSLLFRQALGSACDLEIPVVRVT